VFERPKTVAALDSEASAIGIDLNVLKSVVVINEIMCQVDLNVANHRLTDSEFFKT
jgi:hypothetical protein